MQEIQEKEHAAAIQKRMDASPKIREIMCDMQREIGCDRVYILEAHNGGDNLTKLPFVYIDLTYAEPNKQNYWLEDEYKNVRLSRYPWASKVYEDQYWAGTLADMEKVDYELFCRLQKEEVGYMAAIMMYGENNPIGVLGIVYKDGQTVDPKLVKSALVKYSSRLTNLLKNE